MSSWLRQLRNVQQQGKIAIAVAVASTKGSVPREAGTRMIVTAGEIFGTIGGGHLEFKAIAIARNILETSGPASLHRFPLGASLGQCCGGLVNLLFEPVTPDMAWVEQLLRLQEHNLTSIAVTPVHGCAGKLLVSTEGQTGSLGSAALDAEAVSIARQRIAGKLPSNLLTVGHQECFFESVLPADFHLVLFGAGHVGRALVKILSELPCRISWIDSRENEFPAENYPNVEKIVSESPEAEVSGAGPGAWFLVMTHSHQLDQAICGQIFKRQDYAYFGLIGSLSKRKQFERRLGARGIAVERLAEMVCPIGAAGIASKEPMAIAVSVAAELLQRREALQNRASTKPTEGPWKHTYLIG